jgi:hypothetical protein
MFVRIARFEGGSTAQIEEEGARIRRDLEAARRGEDSPEVPSELALLASRFEMLSTASGEPWPCSSMPTLRSRPGR